MPSRGLPPVRPSLMGVTERRAGDDGLMLPLPKLTRVAVGWARSTGEEWMLLEEEDAVLKPTWGHEGGGALEEEFDREKGPG